MEYLSKYQQNFCGKWQADSKIYTGIRNTENSHDDIDKQSLNIYTIRNQDLLEFIINMTERYLSTGVCKTLMEEIKYSKNLPTLWNFL